MTDTTGTMGAWKVTLETECGTVDAEGWSFATYAEAWEEVGRIAQHIKASEEAETQPSVMTGSFGGGRIYGPDVTVRIVVEFDPTDDEFTG